MITDIAYDFGLDGFEIGYIWFCNTDLSLFCGKAHCIYQINL